MDIKELIAGITLREGRELHHFTDRHTHLSDTGVDQILNLPVSEEGVCECKDGIQSIYNRFGVYLYDEPCDDCNGTGKRPPKTLKHLIEEARNG